MKSILIILGFCLVLPLMHVSGAGDDNMNNLVKKSRRLHGDQVTMILRMAESGETINGVLKLLENGFLGSGSGGMVFRGLRLKDNKPVAIKFLNKNITAHAKHEYEMFSYLHAIDNSFVENYGIPALYYYGEWKDFIVTAFTELEETLAQRFKSGHEHDIILLFRYFTKQSKYIHSCGVRHNDIKPENIMIRNCESFLIDFDLGSKMIEDNDGRTPLFASLRHHTHDGNRVSTDDWESFLYTICHLLKVPLDWFKLKLPFETVEDKEVASKIYGQLKSNRTRILEIINNSLKNTPVKHVILAFTREIFSSKSIPNYDGFNKVLTEVFQRYFAKKKCFSWVAKKNRDGTVTDPERSEIEKSIKRANTDINNLEIPENFVEYSLFDYPIVDENVFNKECEESSGS